jgi:hypothetical protein
MRTERYRRLFQYALEPGELDEIRAATNGNYAPGNDRFDAHLLDWRRTVLGSSDLFRAGKILRS